MSYVPTTWIDGETPVNAENLNKLEQGVAEIHIPEKLPNPSKLKLVGAVNAEYDGSSEITVEIPAAGADAETETVLSDNLLDKSLLTKGQVFYYGSSGCQLAASTYSHYGYIPLRGAGTYRTKFQQSVHSSTGTRIALVNDNNVWVANANGVCGEVGEDGNWVDFEFVVTEANIAAGVTKVAFDVYELFLGKTMIVKDRDYPSEYIPYGYIEVSTDNGKKLDNVLCEKTAVFLGDSLCAGTTVPTDSEFYNYGWAGIIGENNRMNWTNYGKNGGTITHRGADATCIAKIADTAISEHPNADYVIFEGGCNDADQMKEAGLGVISSDYATFDTTTFSGAFEALVLKLITEYPNAKIGYIIPQKMYTGYADYTAANHIHRKYFDRAVEICDKWGIPVIDLWRGSSLNPKLSTASLYYSDNIQHLTLAGYQKLAPMIEAWMRDLYKTGGVPCVGGSVGTSNAVQYIPQTLTEEQQMNARDNLGLYRTEKKIGTVLDETIPVFNEASGSFKSDKVITIFAGEQYKVNWNGTEYNSVAATLNDGEEEGVILGNIGALTGEGDSGEPFVIIPAYDGAMFYALDGSESVTVSIEGMAEFVHEVPKKFIKTAVEEAVEKNNVRIGIQLNTTVNLAESFFYSETNERVRTCYEEIKRNGCDYVVAFSDGYLDTYLSPFSYYSHKHTGGVSTHCFTEKVVRCVYNNEYRNFIMTVFIDFDGSLNCTFELLPKTEQ